MPEWAKVEFILGIELNHFGLEVVTTVGTTVFSDLVRRWASSAKGGPLLSPSLSLWLLRLWKVAKGGDALAGLGLRR